MRGYRRTQRTDIPHKLTHYMYFIGGIDRENTKSILIQALKESGETWPVWLPKKEIQLFLVNDRLAVKVPAWLRKDRKLYLGLDLNYEVRLPKGTEWIKLFDDGQWLTHYKTVMENNPGES